MKSAPENRGLDLPTPEEFPAFPFNPPYGIQTELMRHLYSSIEKKHVTIVESPTGTGKTLSLLCASLTWLTDHKQRAIKGILEAVAGSSTVDEKDWVTLQTIQRYREELEADERESAERLVQARKRELAMRKKAKARVNKKLKPTAEPKPEVEDNDDAFLPECSDDEDDNISKEVRALMAQVEKKPRRREEEQPTCTKIYYASRTHSQLSQVLPELRRLKLSLVQTPQPTNPPTSTKKRPADDMEENLDPDAMISFSRTVSLGSRKQLCINDDLRAKSKDLDEGCRELLDSGKEKRCPHLPTLDDDSQMLDLRDQILASPKDIEDLAETGRLSDTCPYFGSRQAISQAELVTLPYNLLLQKTAREALGIDLTDQIVIIDEAHNLIPTLLSLQTSRLPYSTLAISLHQVSVYLDKFRTRLSPTNKLHLKRLVAWLEALNKCASEWKENRTSGKKKDKVEVITILELINRLGTRVAGINLLEIETYLRKSKVARKIAGYSDKQTEKEKDPAKKRQVRRGAVPPLHAVENFLVSLAGANDDGRVIFSLVGQELELKYQLLNPAPHFQEVVDVARSVILAGGTMSPISDVIDQLFNGISRDRVTSFSCSHIIPASNLLPLSLSKGPRGGDLDYRALRQSDPVAISELGQIITNFINIVPGGMIVFFPSYNFLNKVKELWDKAGVLTKFGLKKKVFFEPQETTDVERVLQDYAVAVNNKSHQGPKGALLFAVIGAKLSEGLNFADDLARSVLIVGLPFPNKGSPELQERMNYVRRLQLQNGPLAPNTKNADHELYENLCMNAVNQSIGRAIRHRGDWASLVLLDGRYSNASIKSKLPGWIGREMRVANTFGEAIRSMAVFYNTKKKVV
ncbi:helicase C-terminal domain-containing protein [Mycena floridula]|nr:helicase C-terminal domain-containing protein [Mycena floridula]